MKTNSWTNLMKKGYTMKNTKYDFQSIVDRHDTNCVKWDLFGDEFPMWVADMDFKVAPPIQEAVLKRSNHPVYGYTFVPDELFNAYINWWNSRYDFKMLRKDMLYSIGVMPSISSIIRCLTEEGDGILIQSPVNDLDHILELCEKHNVVLISDEIHCDLTDPNISYNPFKSGNNVITCLSPSKSFNIAGFQSSIVHTVNEELYKKIKLQLHIDNSDSCNVFAVNAVVAAYNESSGWLEELKSVLYRNKLIVRDFLLNELPSLKLVESEATYLLWIDCSSLGIPSKSLSDFLRENQGLFLSPGIDFGQNGDDFLRMNIACPESMLIDALDRFKKGIVDLNTVGINESLD